MPAGYAIVIFITMSYVAGKLVSRILVGNYRGFGYPGKLRLWCYIMRRLGNPRLTIPYALGGWITIDWRDYIEAFILRQGTFEPEVWRALLPFLNADEIVWDVGAHTGTLSIRAMLDARVQETYAFEPDPANADILAINLALNKGRVAIFRFALSDQSGIARLYRAPASLRNSGLSSLCDTAGYENLEVLCCTVDELVFKKCLKPPTLMKIDVEGWELHVLQGARQVLNDFPPKAIVFEDHSDISGEAMNKALVEYLKARGYDIERIASSYECPSYRDNFLAIYRRPNLTPSGGQ